MDFNNFSLSSNQWWFKLVPENLLKETGFNWRGEEVEEQMMASSIANKAVQQRGNSLWLQWWPSDTVLGYAKSLSLTQTKTASSKIKPIKFTFKNLLLMSFYGVMFCHIPFAWNFHTHFFPKGLANFILHLDNVIQVVLIKVTTCDSRQVT